MRRVIHTASTAFAGRALGATTASVAMQQQRRLVKLFTDSHEWIDFDSAAHTATMGITAHAQESLGDVVFVGLPTVGDVLEKAGVAGELESVKASSDYYSPIKGEVAEVNEALRNEPGLINSSPEEKGWIMRLKECEEPSGLMTAEEYTAFIEKSN